MSVYKRCLHWGTSVRSADNQTHYATLMPRYPLGPPQITFIRHGRGLTARTRILSRLGNWRMFITEITRHHDAGDT